MRRLEVDYLKASFRRIHGYELKLENPQTLLEKIQWIKLYGNLERFSKYVDKYEVRQYVKEQIGSQYLVPLIGVYQKVEEIDVKSLPNAFVMKATHGSNWNVVVKDKSKLDWPAACAKARKWLSKNYYKGSGERNYKPLKGRIIIESFLKDPSGDLMDYKFFCFHGKPAYIQVHGDRFRDHKSDLYDLEWKKLPCTFQYKHFAKPVEKPKRLTEMIKIAGKLAHRFPLVRVDLYYTNDHIYFGELTFTPGNGSKPLTFEYDLKMGKLLDLTKYNKE